MVPGRIAAMALMALVWTLSAALAQQRPAPDPRLDAATALVDTIGVENLMRPWVYIYLRQVVAYPIQRANPGRGQEVLQIFDARTMPAMEPIWRNAQVQGNVAGLFARGFTPAEAEELRAFFSTPTGRKYAVLSGEMSDGAYNLVARLMTTQTMQGALVAAVQEMERRGIKIPNENR